jgi:hypothetical protein
MPVEEILARSVYVWRHAYTNKTVVEVHSEEPGSVRLVCVDCGGDNGCDYVLGLRASVSRVKVVHQLGFHRTSSADHHQSRHSYHQQ